MENTMNPGYTKKFRTRTEFMERNNGRLNGIWEVALDLGYSSVKEFSPNGIACFPAYARMVENDFNYIGDAPAESILYRDLDTNETWVVGEVAQSTVSSGDTSDSEATLYNRDRYMSKMFRVIANAGLGVSMMPNMCGGYKGEKIVIQTGLPERYMSDEDDLIAALAGKKHFSIKVGNRNWKEFNIHVSPENIYVMSQPKGTLFSVCIGKNGQVLSNARDLLNSSVLVFDPGFGTLDLFPIICGSVGKGETFSELGMKRVLQETIQMICEEYHIRTADISVPSMQKYLDLGYYKYMEKKLVDGRINFESIKVGFDNLLKKANEKICDEALNKMSSVFNLIDFNYIIITGGTSEAWMGQIFDRFKNFDDVRIIKGSQNDVISGIYNNVRGYYLYRFNKLAQKKG